MNNRYYIVIVFIVLLSVLCGINMVNEINQNIDNETFQLVKIVPSQTDFLLSSNWKVYEIYYLDERYIKNVRVDANQVRLIYSNSSKLIISKKTDGFSIFVNYDVYTTEIGDSE